MLDRSKRAVASRVFRPRLSVLRQKANLWQQVQTPEAKVQYQLKAFNAEWQRAVRSHPFYEWWAAEHGLPPSVSSIDDVAGFPVLTKRVLQMESDRVTNFGTLNRFVSTGGTTGQPLRVPTSSDDADRAWANMYLGRSWWGVEPFDHQLMVWGHAALFGAGCRRMVIAAQRAAADRMLNIRRLNAYNVTAAAVDESLRSIGTRQPAFVYGYTSAIFMLAKRALERGISPVGAAPKVVIVTSESVSPSDVEVIEQAFAAPVAIEYGAVETGVLSYSATSAEQAVFWDDFLITNVAGEIRVTTTAARTFPLINYELGDVVEPSVTHNGSVLSLRRVSGRTQDVLQIPVESGSEPVNALLLLHITKAFPGLLSMRFDDRDDQLLIEVLGATPVDVDGARSHVVAELAREGLAVDASRVIVRQVDSELTTMAGKRVIRLG